MLTVITLLFLTGLFEDLPEAMLGAVVIAALINLVDVGLARMIRLPPPDRVEAAANGTRGCLSAR